MKPGSLFGQTALTLGIGMLILQVLSIGLLGAVLIMPLAKRSAADLAGLIAISAKTYVELPPETRPDFQASLLIDNGLVIEPAKGPLPGRAGGHFYAGLLEKALAHRLGHAVQVHLAPGAKESYWVEVPMGGQRFFVQFDRDRLASNLPTVLFGITGGATLLLLVLSAILVRRTLRPLGRLAAAIRRVAAGRPEPLPETGPLELADLARSFNAMQLRINAFLDQQTVLLSGISHDLRSPLARLAMAVELLPAATPAKLRGGMADDIVLMDRLVGQSLEFGRGVAAREAESFDLCALLRELAEIARRDGLEMECDLPRRCRCRGYPIALRRILTNLLDNARQHGGGRATLIAGRERDLWRVAVCDRGSGIPVSELEAVFRPFYRLDRARAPGGGSGLGLAIARQLAEAAGMELRLENHAEGGLCAELRWDERSQ